MIGYINSIESFATMDGGGIRFMVFMQGCPLKCVYCHNVDTQFYCAINTNEKEYNNLFNNESIDNNQSLENNKINFITMSQNELANKIIKNKHYYENGGGVTFSGGEPLMQAEFILNVVKLLKEHKIHIAIDTSLCLCNENTKLLINESDLIIADIKFTNKDDYELHTKSSTAFSNLCKNLEYCRDKNKKLLLRTVILEGINSTYKHIDGYINFVNSFKGLNISEYELLAFHTLGFSKYESLNIKNELINMQPYSLTKLQCLQAYLNERLKL